MSLRTGLTPPRPMPCADYWKAPSAPLLRHRSERIQSYDASVNERAGSLFKRYRSAAEVKAGLASGFGACHRQAQFRRSVPRKRKFRPIRIAVFTALVPIGLLLPIGL